MPWGEVPSPPTPSRFFLNFQFFTSMQTLYAKTLSLYFFLSFYSFVYLLYLSLSHLSERMGERHCAFPPNPPPAFVNIMFFSHTSIQLPLSICLCPSPPVPTPLQLFYTSYLCTPIYALLLLVLEGCIGSCKNAIWPAFRAINTLDPLHRKLQKRNFTSIPRDQHARSLQRVA